MPKQILSRAFLPLATFALSLVTTIVVTVAFASSAHAGDTAVINCETLIIFHSPTDKEFVSGSITIAKKESGGYEATMISGNVTQQSSDVDVNEADVKDIDMASITDVVKAVAPEVEIAAIKKATAGIIRPVNKGDSTLMLLDLKDSESKSLVKLLNFDDGAMIGRCEH